MAGVVLARDCLEHTESWLWWVGYVLAEVIDVQILDVIYCSHIVMIVVINIKSSESVQQTQQYSKNISYDVWCWLWRIYV